MLAMTGLTALISCLYLTSASALLRHRSALPGEKRQTLQLPASGKHSCVAWRQTNFCSPYGCAQAVQVLSHRA